MGFLSGFCLVWVRVGVVDEALVVVRFEFCVGIGVGVGFGDGVGVGAGVGEGVGPGFSVRAFLTND